MKEKKVQRLKKSPTGIEGFDEITFGGVPAGRPTLICGSAGCGKTLFAMEFIVKGAVEFNEPGVFISFEEMPDELIQNVNSLGFDVQDLIKKKLMLIDYVHIEKTEIEETGEYNLEGLFIRLEYLINSINAKRIVLDTIESLFSGISNHAILRAELRRLLRWLKERNVTAVITAERGDKTLTREGLEEYVSDCVVLLDHRVTEQYSTRRLRIIKYRGSYHGTNEYPFIIDEKGITVLPISSLKLQHKALNEKISTGIKTLDEMFGGSGYYRGSTVLVSGTAGSGKTSLAVHFADASCRRGEKTLYVAMEESKDQIIRNMKSIGLNVQQWEKRGLLKFHVTRPTYYSLEMHLAIIQNIVNEFHPRSVILDPISNFTTIASINQASSLLTRLIDFLKINKITALFTHLISGSLYLEATDVGVSSLVDTWISLSDLECNGERNRLLYVIKSRGIAHSNQVREFLLTSKGVRLVDVYVCKEGILIGSARKAQQEHDEQRAEEKEQEKKNLNINIGRIEKARDAKIDEIKSEFDAQILELKQKTKKAQSAEEKTISSYRLNSKNRQILSDSPVTLKGKTNGKNSE
ncbi:MAG TPA: circadian clock protein KaiC [Ignavibacteriaceae bacterium]|nr:circadian clock protein KaiC [Ignavibacteriaceae bacterium]